MRRARSFSELTQRNVEAIAKLERASEEQRTFGERVADRFAAIVGSWPFILLQTTLLAAWVTLNVVAWTCQWDPYPFILLNLVLSFQSAYASPIIMMSQNRQARLMERRNQLDLQINLLAEQETTEILRLLRRLCEHSGISLKDDPDACLMEEHTRPESVVRQIEAGVESARCSNGKKDKKEGK
jgi:uncharacterized membrane protein